MARKHAKDSKTKKLVFYNKIMGELLIREQDMELRKEEALKMENYCIYTAEIFFRIRKAEGGEALVRWKPMRDIFLLANLYHYLKRMILL